MPRDVRPTEAPASAGRNQKPLGVPSTVAMPHDLHLYHAWLDDAQSELLNALAHPVRIRILHHLGDGEATVATLAERLSLSASAVAEHLHLLWHARVVTLQETDAGRAYRLVDPRLLEAIAGIRSFTAAVHGRSRA